MAESFFSPRLLEVLKQYLLQERPNNSNLQMLLGMTKQKQLVLATEDFGAK